MNCDVFRKQDIDNRYYGAASIRIPSDQAHGASALPDPSISGIYSLAETHEYVEIKTIF